MTKLSFASILSPLWPAIRCSTSLGRCEPVGLLQNISNIARSNLEIGVVRGADYADLDEQINDCDEKGALPPAPSLELQPHVLATPPPFPAVRLLGMLLRACAATLVEKGPLYLNCCFSTRTLFQAIA